VVKVEAGYLPAEEREEELDGPIGIQESMCMVMESSFGKIYS
jgi:hypothetical protein